MIEIERFIALANKSSEPGIGVGFGRVTQPGPPPGRVTAGPVSPRDMPGRDAAHPTTNLTGETE